MLYLASSKHELNVDGEDYPGVDVRWFIDEREELPAPAEELFDHPDEIKEESIVAAKERFTWPEIRQFVDWTSENALPPLEVMKFLLPMTDVLPFTGIPILPSAENGFVHPTDFAKGSIWDLPFAVRGYYVLNTYDVHFDRLHQAASKFFALRLFEHNAKEAADGDAVAALSAEMRSAEQGLLDEALQVGGLHRLPCPKCDSTEARPYRYLHSRFLCQDCGLSYSVKTCRKCGGLTAAFQGLRLCGTCNTWSDLRREMSDEARGVKLVASRTPRLHSAVGWDEHTEGIRNDERKTQDASKAC